MTLSAQTITIRPLVATDNDAWRELWAGYLDYYETTLPEDVFQSTFARLIGDDPQDFCGLVAEKDNQLVGLTHFLFHRTGWAIENTCYLQDLYTAPSVRGSGVGRLLIQAVYAAADTAGAPKVYWLTQDFNKTARVLYDRVGKLTPFIKYQRS